MAIIYRTAGAWGAGAGANLSAAQVDGNFYDLDGRVEFMELNPPEPVQITSFTASGDQFYVHMSDGSTQGPLTLPVVGWTFRGPWTATTVYLENDVVLGPDSAVYIVLMDHTSGSTFDPGANDGLGHDYYSLLLSVPAATLPSGGGLGAVLTKHTASDFDVMWAASSAPPGGSTGEVLQKNSSTDGDADWNTLVLSDLGDFSLDTAPADGDYLRWDATAERWINRPATTVLTASSWAPAVGDDGVFMVLTNSATPVTITIPADADEAFPIGTELHIHQDGTGTVTIDSDTGVDLLFHSNFTNELLGQYATATVKKTAADEWRLFGLLASA